MNALAFAPSYNAAMDGQVTSRTFAQHQIGIVGTRSLTACSCSKRLLEVRFATSAATRTTMRWGGGVIERGERGFMGIRMMLGR